MTTQSSSPLSFRADSVGGNATLGRASAALRPPRPRPETIAFLGRSSATCLGNFALTLDDLAGSSTLDVGAGPGALAADANRAGHDVVACDPLYRLSHDALGLRGEAGLSVGRELIERDRSAFGSEGQAEALLADRRSALDTFLGDYASGRANGRYLAGSLPHLPFADGAFDRVLCGHLLFLYDDRLDLDFHRRAIRELLRVARREVRLFPLNAFHGEESALLRPVLDELRPEGYRLIFLAAENPGRTADTCCLRIER
jgi:SAM-dependent methyltransferase